MSEMLANVEKIGSGIDYSTDEQWTGKYWIDGKKIYRKVIELTNPAYNWTSISLASYISNLGDYVFKKYGLFVRADRVNEYYKDSADYLSWTVNYYPSDGWRILIKSTSAVTKAYLILDYTKATD